MFVYKTGENHQFY